MRSLVVLLLAAVATGEETRAWRGVISVRAVGRKPHEGTGREVQEERIEFVLVHTPASSKDMPSSFKMRRASGTYSLSVDRTDRGVVTLGSGKGKLFPTVAARVHKGQLKLEVSVMPRRAVVLTTMSGIDHGRFQTWRTPLDRACFLGSFKLGGAFNGRLIEGTREFADHKTQYPRDVRMEWRVERIDPFLRGTIVDHLGRPVPHMTATGQTTTTQRARKRMPPFLRSGPSDREGRFRIEAFWATWSVGLTPMLRDGVLYVPRDPTLFRLRFDDAPDPAIVVDAYRFKDLPNSEHLTKRFRGDAARYVSELHKRHRDALASALVRR